MSQLPMLTEKHLREKAQQLRNWGMWGPEDEIGTLNYITPEDVVAAAKLVRKGKVMSLAFPFDAAGPQTGKRGRHNPIHMMLRSGTDAFCGCQDADGLRYSDDAIMMPLQSGTQWDALSHIFFDDKMYNGYDIRLVDNNGAKKLGIQMVKDKIAGRGVLVDVARHLGVDSLDDGFPIGPDLLEEVIAKQKVKVGRGDCMIVRTGHLERCAKKNDFSTFSGNAPGLSFASLDWLHANKIAAVASDTYAVEVRPEQFETIKRPWHWIAIPMIGLTVGEIFKLDELSADCAADGVYDFFFVAPPLPFTGAVGSPVNPIAIK